LAWRVKDYAHSTAPNRRYSDLVTQRLLKAAIAGDAAPVSLCRVGKGWPNTSPKPKTPPTRSNDRLTNRRRRCSLLRESANRMTLSSPALPRRAPGVRLRSLPVEGRVMHGFEGADVGDRIRVKLVSVDVERGFIDFSAKR
jgi:exoribonuclease R